MDPATFVVAEQTVSTAVEGAAIAGVGLAQSTQPLNATFTRITSEAFLPRSSHTITVVAGKAYIFGGEEAPGKLANDNVHIVRLPTKQPSSNVGEPDYKCVPSLGEEDDDMTPAPRSGHTACALGHRVYILGGRGKDMKPIEEEGRVWVFDTQSTKWSFLDPPAAEPYPTPRYHHGCVASEHPLPPGEAFDSLSYSEQVKTSVNKIQSLVGKASPPTAPHGSLVICGGISSSEPLQDTWTFVIASHTWSKLPSTPSLSSPPSLAFVNNILYLLSSSSSNTGGEIHTLHLDVSKYQDRRGSAELEYEPTQPEWTTLPFPANPLAPGPRARKGSGLTPITTGNGRYYLLYFMGEKAPSCASAEEPEFWSDAWTYQIPATSITASGIKDKTRSLMGIATGEGTWAEVKVIANEEGSGGLETEGKSHPGPRGWFASSAFNGGEVLIWGGINAKGETEGEGWIVSIK